MFGGLKTLYKSGFMRRVARAIKRTYDVCLRIDVQTGAIITALGNDISGHFTPSAAMAERVKTAAANVGALPYLGSSLAFMTFRVTYKESEAQGEALMFQNIRCLKVYMKCGIQGYDHFDLRTLQWIPWLTCSHCVLTSKMLTE